MHEEPTGSIANDQRLGEAIAAYLDAQRDGKPVEQQSLIACYPELAEPLRAFFADDEQMRRLLPPGAVDAGGETTVGGLPGADECRDHSFAPTLGSPSAGASSGNVVAVSPTPNEGRGEPAVGDTVRYFGDYELIEEIAHGGMGVVFKARQVSLNRVVALKMILSGQFASRADVQRFRSEAEAAARLDHSNIVPIYEVGEHRGMHYYTMRLMEGTSLSARLGEFAMPTLNPETGKDLAGTVWSRLALRQRQEGIAALVTTTATAVHFAHQRGVLHRDLKPANILLDRNGAPHVTDFGIAKKLEVAEDAAAAGLTQTGAVLGTPAFMAPEQAGGKKGITTAADVYSLGAILYQLLTGRPPFTGESALEILLQVRDRDPVAPVQVNPALDRDLSTICLACLQKDPSRRYGSAEALARDLERWRAGEPILARPSTAAERAVKWARRRPAVAGLSAAVVLVAVGGFVGVVLAWHRAEVAHQAAARLAITEARARDDAQRATGAAQAARDSERRQRIMTETALASANTNLYFNRIKLAYGSWSAGNIAEAINQLDACPAELRQWEWNYLQHLCHPERMTIQLPTKAEWYFGYSGNGNRLVACAATGPMNVIVFDAADGSVVRRFTSSGPEPDGPNVHAAGISADGETVAIGSSDGSVDLWSVATGKIERRVINMNQPTDWISLALSPDGRLIAATGAPREIMVLQTTVFPLAGGEPLFHSDTASCVAFSPDSNRLVLNDIGRIEIVDTVTWKSTLAFGPAVSGVALSGDGRKLALLEQDSTGNERIRIIGAATGTELLSVRTPKIIGDLALNGDGSRIAAEGELDAGGNFIWVWNGLSGDLVATLRGHGSEMKCLTFSPDGSSLAAVDRDHVIRVWDPRSSGEVTMLPDQIDSRPGNVVVDQDLSMAAYARSSAPNDQIEVWDIRADHPGKTLRGHKSGPLVIAISRDGGTLVSGSTTDGTARAWNIATGEQRCVFNARRNAVGIVAVSPDSHWAASADIEPLPTSPNEPIHVWDTRTGQERCRYNAQANSPIALSFSPDATLVASADLHEIRLWDSSTARERLVIKSPLLYCSHLVFSPDGRQLVAAGISSDVLQAVFVWDINSGKFLYTLGGNGSTVVNSIAFSRDGRRIATAAANMVKINDAATGIELLALPGISAGIRQIGFGSDGRRLLAVLETGAICYWDAAPSGSRQSEAPDKK